MGLMVMASRKPFNGWYSCWISPYLFVAYNCRIKCDQIRSFLQFPADLVRFREEIVNGKTWFFVLCIFWNPGVVTVSRCYFFQLILLRIALTFRDCNLRFYVTARPFFPIIVLFLICELHCLSSIIVPLAEISWYICEWLRP